MPKPLIADYDTALFDLDGVLYLGPEPVAGAVAGVQALVAAGARCIYVTNNAARAVETVVEHLNHLGFPANLDDVVTSAQAAEGMLRAELPAGAKVLVAGTASLVEHVRRAGMVPVFTAADDPAAVIQGYDPKMDWPRLTEAAVALHQGAKWFATNDDSTRPTERGIVPGAGSAVLAVGTTQPGRRPLMAGKPYRPLLELALARSGAKRPIFVGDRIDTDIEGAVLMGMDSILVFTGAHGKRDLLAAGPDSRPTCIGSGVGALLAPRRVAEVAGAAAQCGAQLAELVAGEARLRSVPKTEEEQLDALWALASLAWAANGRVLDETLDSLDLIR